MGEKARRWFLLRGLIIAVFAVRGLLPWLIVWLTTPSLGPLGALLATFSSDPAVVAAIGESAPVLLIFGGTFPIEKPRFEKVYPDPATKHKTHEEDIDWTPDTPLSAP